MATGRVPVEALKRSRATAVPRRSRSVSAGVAHAAFVDEYARMISDGVPLDGNGSFDALDAEICRDRDEIR